MFKIFKKEKNVKVGGRKMMSGTPSKQYASLHPYLSPAMRFF